MGLLKAGIGALGSVLADQWRDYIYADSLGPDVLVVKGQKRAAGRFGSNHKGNDNVISNGSIVSVNDGQCMLIVDQGKVAELCAEPGEFVYDTSTEPSVFYGDLGENIKASFANVGKRFAFGGDAGKDQRVYYFNTKEIIGNKYGTANPVPFRVVDNNVGLDVDISLRCHGEYSYRIVNPMLFYTNVSGNVQQEYTRDAIDSQLKTELMTALQPAFAKISEMGIRYSAIPGHTMELSNALNQVLSKKWSELRGIAIVSFGMSSIKASDEDETMIKELQRNAAFRNPNMAAAHLVGAQAQATQDAARNEGQGPVMAFAGMNMATNAGGTNVQNLYAMGQTSSESAPKAEGWVCSCGAKGNAGKFCMECGKSKPQDGWACSCGAVNKGRYCAECGKPKPINTPKFKCDKCGWEPEDASNAPKFCPECGDIFDESDQV